jgi:redox-sensing transcriptional repressor
MPEKPTISEKTISRLSLYRRMLERVAVSGRPSEHIFSHELAVMSGSTAVLVRRDLMAIGFTGNPKKGYRVSDLIAAIGAFLDAPEGEKACLVGVGNLGRALLTYFAYRRAKLPIVAAFDSNPSLAYHVIHGCRCHPVADIGRVVSHQKIQVGIITVPAAAAQDVADKLVKAGVTGLLNLAPVALLTPATVFVESIDMTTSLEKVAFFARQNNKG